ncbi:MAG: hypothetical protein ACOYXW_01380 [Actinomycetota bacterium]
MPQHERDGALDEVLDQASSRAGGSVPPQAAVRILRAERKRR